MSSRAFSKAAWGLVVLGGLLGATQSRLSRAGNEASRWALIESIVDYGQTTLEKSRFGPVVDAVTIDGRQYSNKPPFLACWGAGGYWAVKRLLGWSLEKHPARAIYAVTLWTAGLWTLAFYALLCRDAPPAAAAALVFGTTLFSFSGTINNHTPAAFALLAASAAARKGSAALCGAALGLCLLFDPVFAFFFGAALLWHWRKAGGLVPFLKAAAPWAAVWLALNQWVTGYPLPLYVHPEGPGVVKGWGHGMLVPARGWDYPLQALIGDRGFFLYSPVLLLPLAERRGRRGAGALARALLAAAAAAILFHVCFAGGYGGWSYGYRYLIPLIGVFAAGWPALWSAHKRTAAVLLAVGVPFGLLGAYCPWPPSFQGEGIGPPVFEKIRFNAGSNLACFAAERGLPGRRILEGLFIDPDPYAALWYEIHFFWVAGKSDVSKRCVEEGLARYPGDRALSRRLALQSGR